MKDVDRRSPDNVPLGPPLAVVLARVRDDQRAAGEVFRNGASAQGIATLGAGICYTLGVELPNEYAEFLRRVDGVDFDGVVFYGATIDPTIHGVFGLGLIAANRLWRQSGDHKNMLILGEDDMYLFAVDVAASTIERRDRVTGETTERFSSITTMIAQVLHARLG